MPQIAIILATLIAGWIISLSRKTLRARLIVAASAPTGTMLGNLCGFALGSLFLHWNGLDQSQHSWIAIANFAILGTLLGAMALPAFALAATRNR